MVDRAVLAEQQVAHHPADQVEPVPGRGEGVGEGADLLQHGGEALGDHPVNDTGGPGTGFIRYGAAASSGRGWYGGAASSGRGWYGAAASSRKGWYGGAASSGEGFWQRLRTA